MGAVNTTDFKGYVTPKEEPLAENIGGGAENNTNENPD